MGSEAIVLLDSIKLCIEQNPAKWETVESWKIQKRLAELHSYQDNHEAALLNAQLALVLNDTLDLDVLMANQLKALEREQEAIGILREDLDSTDHGWILNNKGQLLLELGDHESALKALQWASQDTSTWLDNEAIAKAFTKNGLYTDARGFYLKDTTSSWNKAGPIKRLFDHDLKYSHDSLAFQSYQSLRDLGYENDPMGISRVSLFFKAPLSTVHLRDLIGPGILILTIVGLLILPYVWVLPIHYSGKVLNVRDDKLYVLGYGWTLKDFWIASSLYLIVSFTAIIFFEYSTIISWFAHDQYIEQDLSKTDDARQTVYFILLYGIGSLCLLNKSVVRQVLNGPWSHMKSLGKGFLWAIALRFVALFTVKFFGSSIESTSILLSIETSIIATIETYGVLVAFVLVVIFVPIYEEVIFRGVVLTSSNRYLSFAISNTIQAALFAIVHDNLKLFVFYFIFGLITGWLGKTSKSLLSGIYVHCFNNFFAFLGILYIM